MIKLRQRLLPYLYTLFEECHRTGAPILRPLLFAYPEDETTYTTDDEFLLGNAILVAPIFRPGVEHRYVYLPEGSWVHFWTGERLDGPAHVLAHAPLGEPAIYVRANAPLPMGPDAPHTGAATTDSLSVVVHPAAGAAPGTASVYEDAGDGFNHENGEFARREVSCEATEGRVAVRFGGRQGSFAPPRETILLELRGVGSARSVSVNGEGAEPATTESGVVVALPETDAETTVEVVL
jgi:alpha-glucosidase